MPKKQLHFAIDAEDAARFKENAVACGMTMTDYLIYLTKVTPNFIDASEDDLTAADLSEARPVFTKNEIHELAAEVNMVGRDLRHAMQTLDDIFNLADQLHSIELADFEFTLHAAIDKAAERFSELNTSVFALTVRALRK